MRRLTAYKKAALIFFLAESFLEAEIITENSSPLKLTGAVSFVSDYRSRGISQTMRLPAVQGELKASHENGCYLKTWASNVDGTTHFLNNTSLEWDFFLGFKRPFCQTEMFFDIGFLGYYYPGGETLIPKGVSYNSIEYYISIQYKILTITFYQTLTDYFGTNSKNPPYNWSKNAFSTPHGNSRFSPYIEADLEWSPQDMWTIGLHAGYQGVANYQEISYIDWQISLSYAFKWFDFTLYYVATNANPDFYNVPDNTNPSDVARLGAPGIVAGITKNF